jgi:uridine kinase
MDSNKSTSKPLVIGVAGGSGSGKTTVSQAIVERAGAENIVYIAHDLYYRDLSHLPFEERTTFNFDHPNSLDNELLIEHLDSLIRGESVLLPEYDFSTYVRLPGKTLQVSRPIILLEGILIFADPALRSRMQIKLFVDTAPDLRFIRRLKRDIEERGRTIDSVVTQYLSTVRPMHLEFVEPSKQFADMIIPQGGKNQIAIDMVTARIEELLGRTRS